MPGRRTENFYAGFTPLRIQIPMHGLIPVGTRVLMMSGHPHAGKSGEIIRWEVVHLFASEGPKPVIRLDDGQECFAMDPRHFGVIPERKHRLRQLRKEQPK